MAAFRYVTFFVLGFAFLTILSTIVQNHRLSSEPKVMLTTFVDRWSDFKTTQ